MSCLVGFSAKKLDALELGHGFVTPLPKKSKLELGHGSDSWVVVPLQGMGSEATWVWTEGGLIPSGAVARVPRALGEGKAQKLDMALGTVWTLPGCCPQDSSLAPLFCCAWARFLSGLCMSTWQASQEAFHKPSFAARPGPQEASLVLGQWALERGRGAEGFPPQTKSLV